MTRMAFFRLNKLGLAGLSIAGLALFLYYFPRVYPEAGLDMPVDRTHIETIGRNIAENMGAEISGFFLNQKIEKDLPLLRYLTRAYGPETTNRLREDSSAGYQWVLVWSSERPANGQS